MSKLPDNSLPDLSRVALTTELVKQFKGIEGLAQEFKARYDSATDSPNVQSKMLDIVVSAVLNMPDAKAPVADDEDLIAEAKTLCQQSPEVAKLLQDMQRESS